MAPFNGKSENLLKPYDACLATISEIFVFEIFDLNKLNQSNGVQHSQWSLSMANINLYKSHFWLAFNVFEIFTFQISWPGKCRSRSWTAFAVAPFDCKYLTSYLMAIVMFAFFEHLLVKIANWQLKIWHWKYRKRSRVTTFEMVQYDGKPV